MNVAHLMKRTVHTCRVDQTLNDAAKAMWDNRIGCVVVVNHAGYVAGMMTDRDVCMGAYTTGKTLAQIAIVDAMVKKVVSIRAVDDLAQAERLMREHQIQRLPVVDDAGRLEGILTLADIASHVQPSFDGSSSPLGAHAISVTFAAVTERQAPAEPVASRPR